MNVNIAPEKTAEEAAKLGIKIDRSGELDKKAEISLKSGSSIEHAA